MKNTGLKIIWSVLLMQLSIVCLAQKEYLKAKKHYDNFEYQLAIPLYKQALQNDTTLESVEELADCYRKIHQYKEALKFYKIALDIPYYNSISVFYYAEMLLKMGNYLEAEEQFLFYLNYEPSNRKYVYKQIESCKYARQMRNSKSTLLIENVKELNTKFAETGITYANNALYFSSDRKIGSAGIVDSWTGNSYYKIFTAPLKEVNKNISLQRAKLFDQNINKGYHVFSPSFNIEYNKLYFTITDLEKSPSKKHQIKAKDFVNRMNIYEAELINKRWQKKEKIKSDLEFNYSILHPCINATGNRLYFASDMPGGYGSYDLYYCTIDSGKLSKPLNLGAEINTEGMELYPSMANDSVFYFSSNGHLGFGGLDIYKVNFTETNTKVVQNLGFPINSSYDDFSFLILEKYKIAYFCSDREGGKGKDDIYKIMWLK